MKPNSIPSAGTEAQQSDDVEDNNVSPFFAKPNVVRSSSKVVVSEMKRVDKELEIEYPIYLYFQDESCNDELIMITKEFQIKVRYEYFSLVIEKSISQMIYEHYVTRNLTTKEHFLEVYNEAVKSIAESVV